MREREREREREKERERKREKERERERALLHSTINSNNHAFALKGFLIEINRFYYVNLAI
jgi:hypothetical protein